MGRGALTLGTLQPLMAEALPCPPLSLTGRVPPLNSPLSLDTQTAPVDMTLWPVRAPNHNTMIDPLLGSNQTLFHELFLFLQHLLHFVGIPQRGSRGPSSA